MRWPSAASLTCTYWYGDSASNRIFSPGSSLMVPRGRAIIASSTTGAAMAFAPSRGTAASASTPAMRNSVARVPMAGTSTSTGRNVPTMLPTVEMAYSRPATDPAVSTSFTDSRIAHGDTVPSSVMGMRNISIVPTNDATNAPADRSAKAPCAARKMGVSASGRIATVTAATMTTQPSTRGLG